MKRLTAIALAVVACASVSCETRPDDWATTIAKSIRQPLAEGPRFAGGVVIPFERTDRAIGESVVISIASDLAEQANAGAPKSLQSYGVARLALGFDDEGVAALERASTAAPDDPAIWSDLAGAYLLKAHAVREGAHEYWLRALDVAIRATNLDPGYVAAWQNRALAIERANLLGVEDAWSAADAIAGRPEPSRTRPSDRRARWATIAKQLSTSELGVADVLRLAPEYAQPLREYLDDVLLPELSTGGHRLPRLIERARAIAEALEQCCGDALPHDTVDALAGSQHCPAVLEGHAAYGDARREYEHDRYANARDHFERAEDLLRSCNSPFWMWARAYRAFALFHLRERDRMRELLVPLTGIRSERPYLNLHARVTWAIGVADFQAGAIEAGLRGLDAAIETYLKTREFENVGTIAASAAEVLRQLGDDRGAWVYLSRSLERFTYSIQPVRQYLALFSASLLALEYDLPYAGVFLQDSAIRAGRLRGTAGPVVEGLTRRAAARLKAGDRTGALRDIVRAYESLRSVTEPRSVTSFRAGLMAVHADLLDDRPRDAFKLLRTAVVQRAASQPSEMPALLLRLARAAAVVEGSASANRYLADGIARFEHRGKGVESHARRVSFLDEGWDLYSERLALMRKDGAPADALLAESERMKARGLRELAFADVPVDVKAVARRLGHDETIVAYALQRTKPLAWIVSRSGVKLAELSVSSTDLNRWVAEYRTALALSDDSPDLRFLSRRLFDTVLGPFADTIATTRVLAIVPDGVLHALPFATLITASGRYLVETAEVITAPNLDVLLRSTTPSVAPPRSILAVGDPTFDTRRFPGLRRLPDARREVSEVSAMYGASDVLLQERATAAALADAMGRHEVVHFAGHAIENPHYPWRSALLLAQEDGGGLVYAEQIARWKLNRVQTVVLAACNTGIGRIFRGEGAVSLATPFLAAGVRTVVSTLWEVEDRAARSISREFHAKLSEGISPPAALRRSQLTLLNNSDVRLRSPRHWGGYVAIGGATFLGR